MAEPVYHHNALGIHPGAYYQPTMPTPHNDGDLWIDTSAGPPYQLKVWDATADLWRLVGAASTGVDPSGAIVTTCLTFPLAAQICNTPVGEIHYHTPASEHAMDATGYVLPGGHRLEVA